MDLPANMELMPGMVFPRAEAKVVEHYVKLEEKLGLYHVVRELVHQWTVAQNRGEWYFQVAAAAMKDAEPEMPWLANEIGKRIGI